ncbi:hypothetical protein [Roseiconus lacunae]|uniref:PH domain-containing protein n=1 Tax=Roseiconus lacunae TaxID=2605694 RepID=A0ABT7PM74_9BACT|nr:hypothetical protein [Roseiconus lacunae]MDM4017597.1 hypothetical protein [Roseiconus lacunae]
MSEPVHIPINKSHATVHFASWAVMSLLSCVLTGFGIALVIPKGILPGLFVTIAGLVLAGSAGYMCWRASQTFRLKEPVLEFTEHGFMDRRFCAQLIPWGSMQWKADYSKLRAIQIEVAPEAEHAVVTTPVSKVLHRCCVFLKLPRYLVSPLSTGRSVQELEEIFGQFKPQEGAESEQAERASAEENPALDSDEAAVKPATEPTANQANSDPSSAVSSDTEEEALAEAML